MMQPTLTSISLLVFVVQSFSATETELLGPRSVVGMGTLVISVFDDRESVKDGKPLNYVGRMHCSFGRPVDYYTNWLLSNPPSGIQCFRREAPTATTTLAQFLTHQILGVLEDAHWTVKAVELRSPPDIAQVRRLLRPQPQNSRLVVLSLREWYFDIYPSQGGRFTFNTDVVLNVFAPNGGQVLRKHFIERDVIQHKRTKLFTKPGVRVNSNVLPAYRTNLEKILDDSEVQQAFISDEKASEAETSPVTDKYFRLTKIKELFDKGVLTQSEFESEKKKILSEND